MSRIGLVLAVAAALWFTEGGLRGAVCGALLLGAVAGTDLLAERLRNGRRDRLDLWLAQVLGRLREYVVYAGLAIGGTAAGVPDAWAWAAGALIALALRDSAAAARSARVGEPEWTPESGLARPVDAVDPSRHLDDGSPGDPSLTAELLGDGDSGEGEGGADDGRRSDRRVPRFGPPPGIRTVPKGAAWPGWDAGRAEVWGEPRAETPDAPDGTRSSAAEDPHGDSADRAESTAATGGRRGRAPADRRRSPPLARLAAFPQAARFGAVALTITIWDVRVTFIALIVGCALALTGELIGGPARDTAR
ncbi:hypothetical protein [Streptomonospora litoralis]|nr:hypothetical protein [Streptomonospora litoralis]